MYRVRHNLTTEAMISIYYTLVYPHLTYCVSLWASTWPSFLNKLTISQNKFLRCIFFMKKFDSTEEIYKTRKILKLPCIHKYFSLLLIYKTIGYNSIFQLRENPCHTRSNNVNLSLPIFRTTLFKNSIINFAPELFNSLPVSIKLLLRGGTYDKYKREVKKHLLNAQILSIL